MGVADKGEKARKRRRRKEQNKNDERETDNYKEKETTRKRASARKNIPLNSCHDVNAGDAAVSYSKQAPSPVEFVFLKKKEKGN